MKRYIINAILFFSISINAQVGIGTQTPHTSAMLEMNVNNISPKKGFLIPRFTLNNNQDTQTIPNPVNAMTGYNLANAGTGNQLIEGNSFVVWDKTRWQKISSLAEVRQLKSPIEFVSTAKTNQNFTTTNQLTDANLSLPVEIQWVAENIQIPNNDDVLLENNHFKILNPALYQLSGMVNFRANVTTAGDPTHVILVVQKSLDKITWTNILASSLPLENQATGKTQSITIPNIIHRFVANQYIRLVIYKPSTSNSYAANSGVIINVADDTSKSIRILKVQE